MADINLKKRDLRKVPGKKKNYFIDIKNIRLRNS